MRLDLTPAEVGLLIRLLSAYRALPNGSFTADLDNAQDIRDADCIERYLRRRHEYETRQANERNT